MAYQATLSSDQVKEFVNDFMSIESSKGTEIRITPSYKFPNLIFYYVTLIPNDFVLDCLEASFQNGMMSKYNKLVKQI
jgi:hypothetical protein